VYLYPEELALENQIIVLLSYIGGNALKHIASNGLSTAIAPQTKLFEIALRRFVNQNKIPRIRILEFGTLYQLSPTSKVEMIKAPPPLLSISIIGSISEADPILEPLRLIDVSNWQMEKPNIPDNWTSPLNFMIVDFEQPEQWLPSTLSRKQIVVDKEYLHHAFLLYSDALAGEC
jgi:hypothetical protein